MGKLVNFCAGTELKKRPKKAKAYLFNPLDHGSKPHRIKKAKSLCQSVKPTNLMSDSGGYQLLDAEKKKWKITHAPDCPLIYSYKSKEFNLAPKSLIK